MASVYLGASIWPAYIAAAASLALAGWLLRVDWRRPVHRRFALYLVLSSGAAVLFSLVQVSEDLGTAKYLLSVWVYWATASFVALLWFAASYARARPIVAISIEVTSALLGFVILTTYVLNRAIFWTLGEYGQDAGIRVGPTVFADGPMLWAFVVLRGGIFAAVWMLARRHASSTFPRIRRSAFIVALGLLVPAAYASARILGLVFFSYEEVVLRSGVSWKLVAFQTAIDGIAGGAVVLASAWLMLRHGTSDTPEARTGVVGTALVVSALAAGFSLFGYRGPLAGLMDGIVALALPVLATYGILRHQLFDIDVKARLAVKSGTLGAIFVTVIFVVSEGAQNLFGADQQWLGLLAGGVLVFALAPLQRYADSIARAAVPDATPVVDMDADEKAAAYAEVVRMAWVDGQVTAAERHGLEALRKRLGISVEDAHSMEQTLLAELA